MVFQPKSQAVYLVLLEALVSCLTRMTTACFLYSGFLLQVNQSFFKFGQIMYLDPLFHYLFSLKQIESPLKFQNNSKI